LNRRGFLGSILVAAAAPAIVRADSLMRIVPMGAVVLQVPWSLDPRALLLEEFRAQHVKRVRLMDSLLNRRLIRTTDGVRFEAVLAANEEYFRLVGGPPA
jgi:hypothetical protein